MTTQIQRVPALRFPGFSGEWEETTVQKFVDEGVFAKPMDGNHGNIHPVASDFVDDGIPFIMANDLRRGKLDFDRVKMISKEQADNLQKGFAKTGDVLLTHKATLGELAIISEIPWDYIMLTPQVTYYRVVDHQRYSNLFLFQYFATQKFQAELENKATGATRLYIGITEQRKLGIPVCSFPEQQKISSFLSSVDTKIEQLTKKKAKLEKYKKGIMQKLFSQEIRFKDEEGKEYPEWEEKRLGNVASLQGGYAFKSSKFKNEGIPIIRISNISNTNNYIDHKNLVFYDEVAINKNFELNKYDLIIAMSGATTGKASIYNLDYVSYVNQRVGVFRVLASLSNRYLTQFVFSVYFSQQLDRVLVAGAQPNISSKDIENLTLPLPSLPEQQKIANFLSSIDDKIEQVGGEIEKTQIFKKGLLQQMFV